MTALALAFLCGATVGIAATCWLLAWVIGPGRAS